jgi:hypothetical protein
VKKAWVSNKHGDLPTTTNLLRPSRILDVILPDNFDNSFVELHNAYNCTDRAGKTALNGLAEKFGIRYL